MKEAKRKDKEKLYKLFDNLIYLSKCTLNGEEIRDFQKRFKNIDWKELYQVAKHHSIDVIVYTALEKLSDTEKEILSDVDREIFDNWKKEKEYCVYRALLMDIERENIVRFMEEHEIWYMPLKGIVLKEFYPFPEMRQMVDNDILFDKVYRRILYNYMIQNGYNTINYNEKHYHDEYIKPPVYNFEMHAELFGEKHDTRWQEYYKNIKEKLIKDSNSTYEYHFSDEDFYVYMTVHAYNHYIRKGTGLRTVMDYYVFVKEKWNEIDLEYIRKQLEKLGVAEFEEDFRNLGLRLFNDSQEFCDIIWSAKERDMLDYILGSGALGTFENNVKYKMKIFQEKGNNSNQCVRLKYIISRLFPNMEYFKENYPVIHKYKLLLPFGYLYRILKALFVKQKRVRQELKAVLDKNK